MTGTRSGRLVGLDVARCLALLGMVATHVLDERTPAGDLTTAQWLAGGRASALFAVLAGVSLALMTREPLRGRPLALRTLGIAVRALLIGGARPAARRPGHRHRDHPHLLRRAVRPGPAVHAPGRPLRSCRSPSRGSPSRRWSRTWCGRTCRSGGSTARPSSSSPTPGSWRASCSSPATTRSCRGWPTSSPVSCSVASTCATPRCSAAWPSADSRWRCSRRRSRGRWSTRRSRRRTPPGCTARRPPTATGTGCCSSRPTRRRRSTSPRPSAARSW